MPELEEILEVIKKELQDCKTAEANEKLNFIKGYIESMRDNYMEGLFRQEKKDNELSDAKDIIQEQKKGQKDVNL